MHLGGLAIETAYLDLEMGEHSVDVREPNTIPMSDFEVGIRRSGLAAPTEPDRSYVIKLSRYNDSAPEDRDRDVAAINMEAASRANGFRNEAVIAVTRTSGVDELDEVTLLYYESPAQGKAFREANGDLLKRIGAFNEAHLVDYVYMNASAER